MSAFVSSVEFARAHAVVLRQAARACEAALARAGVRALVVGSLAYGGVRPESDLDLLVVSHPGKKWSEVSAIAAGAARPYRVRVDVIFADTLPPALRQALLKDARTARSFKDQLAIVDVPRAPRKARRSRP